MRVGSQKPFKFKRGQLVGIDRRLRGTHAIGRVLAIKKRPGTTPLVMLWVHGFNQWSGYEHLDAAHLQPLAVTKREARAEMNAFLRSRCREPGSV